ncbi:unnamed protein product [Acanthosepion pharaonis]|uniref:Uncharacterized protein n=1 Tax=Acanthosepion pharaonis TaxID=158019 RepID=A0A812BSP5_ACAPH|nr:unnamed protein product [Sepia pharaonis]
MYQNTCPMIHSPDGDTFLFLYYYRYSSRRHICVFFSASVLTVCREKARNKNLQVGFILTEPKSRRYRAKITYAGSADDLTVLAGNSKSRRSPQEESTKFINPGVGDKPDNVVFITSLSLFLYLDVSVKESHSTPLTTCFSVSEKETLHLSVSQIRRKRPSPYLRNRPISLSAHHLFIYVSVLGKRQPLYLRLCLGARDPLSICISVSEKKPSLNLHLSLGEKETLSLSTSLSWVKKPSLYLRLCLAERDHRSISVSVTEGRPSLSAFQSREKRTSFICVSVSKEETLSLSLSLSLSLRLILGERDTLSICVSVSKKENLSLFASRSRKKRDSLPLPLSLSLSLYLSIYLSVSRFLLSPAQGGNIKTLRYHQRYLVES